MKNNKLFITSLIAAAAMTTTAFAGPASAPTGDWTPISSDTTKSESVGGYKVSSGTLTLESANALTFEQLYTTAGNITIGTNSQVTKVTTGRIEMGDDGSSGTTNLSISTGSTFVVTGNNNTSGYGSASILLGEWERNTTIDINGTFIATEAKIQTGDQKTTLNISGSLATKGFGIAQVKDSKTNQGIALNLNDNGKLILGDNGINVAKGWSSSIETATIGTYANETAIQNALTIQSGKTLTIDTTKYTVNSSDGTISVGSEGARITISGALLGEGSLSVSGAGTAVLAGRVDLSSAIQNSGTVKVENTVVFNLKDALKSGDTYTLINGGTINGWNDLTANNFTGATIGGRSDFSAVGKITLGTIYSDLVWSSGTWNTTTTNKAWTRPGQEGTFDFANGDSVTFNTDNASVTIEDAVNPTAMTVSKATTFTGTGTITVAAANLTTTEKMTIGKDITLDLGASNSSITKNIAGAGRVKYESTMGGHGGGVNLGSEFTGTLDYTGKFNTTGSVTIGSTAKIELSSAAGTIASMWGNGTLSNDVLFKTNYQLGDSSGTTFTLSGNVSIADGKTLTVGGVNPNVTISGTLSGANAILTASAGTTNLFGNTTIGTLNSSATTNIQGETSITTANITGGTTNFSSTSTTIGTLNYQSGSALNFSQNSISTVKAFSATGTHSMSIAGVLNITGDKTGVTLESASFMMANGGGKNTITIQEGGVLNLASAGLSVRDGEAELNIDTGGEANFGKGLRLVINNSGWGTNTLNLNGGTLNVGSSDTGDWKGITTDGKSNVKVNLNSGTIGSLADSWTSSMNFALGGQITVDTTKKQISNKGKATEVSGQTGSTVTLSGVLSNATDATASLVKEGLGTLVLNGVNTFSGGVTINAGTIQAGNASALGTGTVKIDGGQLNVADVSLSVSALEIVLSDKYKQGAENSVAAIAGTGSITLNGNKITLSKSETLALNLATETSLNFSVADSNFANSFSQDSFTLGAGWDGWTITSYANGVITLSVPEPSMFGLLAGLGALALVGARRRRKTK